MIELALVGAAGASIGSFLGAYAERWPKGRSLFARSSCDHCHATIRWFDLVPMLSFIVLRGTCRSCGARISMSTLVLELSSLGLALLVLETLGISIVSLLVLVTGLALLSIAVIDWQTYLIPDAPVLVAALCGLLLLTFDGSLMQERFAAGMLFPLFLWLVGKGTSLAMGRASLGFGDVKLVGALGMLLGLMNGFLAIWIAALLGLLYRVSGIRSEEPRIPFGALMAISAEGILLAEYGIIDIPWIAWN